MSIIGPFGVRPPVAQRVPATASRVYLVTGASSGIGHATALALLRRGHIVYGAARRVGLMADLVAAGGRALHMDVTDDASVAAGVATVIAERGRIDGLLANAGYVQMGVIENVSIADAQRQIDVNVFGVARVVKAVLPYMRERGAGSIVVTSSIVGRIAVPGMAWYPASKHALEGFADALRMEVRRFGISVAIIAPDFVDTGLLEASLPTLDAAERAEHAAVYAAEQAHFRERFTESFLRGTPVDEVADVIIEALGPGGVKRRYWPTFMARLQVILKEKLGDGILDRILPRMWLGVGGGDATGKAATSIAAEADDDGRVLSAAAGKRGERA